MRQTRVVHVDPESPASEVLDEAAAILRAGGLVAFATETVYGLGADATNPAAVAGIYEAKGRPAFNPLIVHVDTVAMARNCVSDWPDTADQLARAFWPGPLTLILPRSSVIANIVTAGRDTVGVRIPGPVVTRALISRAGRPLAAPSANQSTAVSPTLAAHVLADLDGRIDLILDSGPTAIGLESTVIDLTATPPRILRPGPISAAALSAALNGSPVLDEPGCTTTDRPASPGQLAVHYSPRTRTIRVDDPGDLTGLAGPESAAVLLFGEAEFPAGVRFAHTFAFKTPEVAARDLYRCLRTCDDLDLEQIVIVAPPDSAPWRAIRDRLWRASQPFASRDDVL